MGEKISGWERSLEEISKRLSPYWKVDEERRVIFLGNSERLLEKKLSAQLERLERRIRKLERWRSSMEKSEALLERYRRLFHPSGPLLERGERDIQKLRALIEKKKAEVVKPKTGKGRKRA
ncbi:MAG: hypothetical protein QXG22_02025 [Candidatus Hadarchaeales archaeon]